MARERGWTFILNPAPAAPVTDELLARCDVLTPNEHELEGLGRTSTDELLAAGVGAVIVTGARKEPTFRPGVVAYHQPAFEVDPADTTGAGDAFTGALAWTSRAARTLLTRSGRRQLAEPSPHAHEEPAGACPPKPSSRTSSNRFRGLRYLYGRFAPLREFDGLSLCEPGHV